MCKLAAEKYPNQKQSTMKTGNHCAAQAVTKMTFLRGQNYILNLINPL